MLETLKQFLFCSFSLIIMLNICLSLILFLQCIHESVSQGRLRSLNPLGSLLVGEPLSASTLADAACSIFKMFSHLTVTGAPCRWETKKENKTTGGYSSCQNTILYLGHIPGPLTDQHNDPRLLLGTTFPCCCRIMENLGFLFYVYTERKSIFLIW